MTAWDALTLLGLAGVFIGWPFVVAWLLWRDYRR